MKPTQSWQFSTTIDRIDIHRILREIEESGGSVALLTIAGKVYTAVKADHPTANKLPDPISLRFDSRVYLEKNNGIPSQMYGICSSSAFIGKVCMYTYADNQPDWLIAAGDHLSKVLDRVVTKVDIYA